MSEKKEKKPLTKEQRRSIGWECFWLSLFGVIWIVGFVMGLLGILAHNAGWITRNPLYQAETEMTELFGWGFRIDWRYFGATLLVIGLIGLVSTLFYFANKYDRAKQRAVRRAERLKAILAENVVSPEAVVSGFAGENRAPQSLSSAEGTDDADSKTE